MFQLDNEYVRNEKIEGYFVYFEGKVFWRLYCSFGFVIWYLFYFIVDWDKIIRIFLVGNNMGLFRFEVIQERGLQVRLMN